MKKMIICLFLTFALSGIVPLKSQELSVREEIDYINSLLKANPYKDTFLEITFYYSIDVTPDSELVVYMDFDGPFKTIMKANMKKLDNTIQIDTALEGTSSICWNCNYDKVTGQNNCVYSEKIDKGGDKESHFGNNICVMVTRQSDIRDKLINAFRVLFKKFPDQ